MRHFDKLAVFLVYIISAGEYSSAASCGKPGHSRNSRAVNLQDREVFDEGFIVKYGCRHGYLPVGDKVRTCNKSRWSDSIPKCPELLNATGLSVRAVRNTTLSFTWKNEMKIVGVQFALRRPSHLNTWPDIDVDRATGMGSLIQVSITGVANDDLRIVSVSTGSPDFRYLDQYNKVILTTNNQVADCTLNAEGQLSQPGNNVVGPYLCIHEDLYGLYHIDETVDDCDTPDTPLNAMVESTYRSGKSAHANYSCVDGYRLKLSKSLQSPTCLENGDWTSYNYQPCEAIYCDKDKTDYVIVRFDQSAASGSRFPTGTKGFLSCSTSRDKRYVVCDTNGSWLPETALCETPFVNLKGLAIGLTFTLVVVVFGIPLIFHWLYRRTQEAPSAVEVPMEHFHTEPLRPNNGAVHYESVNYDYISYDYSVTS